MLITLKKKEDNELWKVSKCDQGIHDYYEYLVDTKEKNKLEITWYFKTSFNL